MVDGDCGVGLVVQRSQGWWFGGPVHLDPANSVRALDVVVANESMTFSVSFSFFFCVFLVQVAGLAADDDEDRDKLGGKGGKGRRTVCQRAWRMAVK